MKQMMTTTTYEKKDIAKYIARIENITEKLEQADMLATVLSQMIDEIAENHKAACNFFYDMKKNGVCSDGECVE